MRAVRARRGSIESSSISLRPSRVIALCPSVQPTPTYQYHPFALTPSAISGDRSLRARLRSIFSIIFLCTRVWSFYVLAYCFYLVMHVRPGQRHSFFTYCHSPHSDLCDV